MIQDMASGPVLDYRPVPNLRILSKDQSSPADIMQDLV